jgi:hypothetical protein
LQLGGVALRERCRLGSRQSLPEKEGPETIAAGPNAACLAGLLQGLMRRCCLKPASSKCTARGR